MNKIKESLSRAWLTLKGSLERFPEALFMAYAFGVVAVLLNRSGYDQTDYREFLNHLLLTFSLGVPLFLSVKMMHESYLKSTINRIALDVFSVIILIAFYLTIPTIINDIFIFRVFVANVSLYLMFSLIPFFYQKKNYGLYVLKLIANFAIASLYTLVLYLGLAAIYFALEELFGLNISSDLYADTFIIVATWFAPTYFLGGLIKNSNEMEDYFYSNVFKMLFVYIIMPLLTIYSGILYAYFIKLLIGRSLPENVIGNLVLWYSGITLVVLFFTSTLKQTNSFTKLFHKWIPIAILLPLSMMFYAIFVRIGTYGLTVRRYFVVALGVWVLFNMIYLIVSKKKVNQVIVLSAIIVMILSMYGPVGAYPMSIWQQNERFETLLQENNMLVDGEIIKGESIGKEQEQAIIEALEYFDRQHDLDDIKVLSIDFDLSKDTEKIFGFAYTGFISIDSSKYFNAWRDVSNDLIDIKDYNQLFQGSWNEYNPENSKVELVAVENGDYQIIFDKELIMQVPLTQWVELNDENNNQQMLTLDQATLKSEMNLGSKMIIKNINGQYDENTGVFTLESIEFILLY